MNKILIKDFFKTISKTKIKFISLLLIVLLGLAFFVGLGDSGNIMSYSMNEYVKENSFYDVQIISNYGINDSDLKNIKGIKNVKDVEGQYLTDLITKELGTVVRVYSYNENHDLNKVDIIKGRYPKSKDECVIEIPMDGIQNYEIGDVITLTEDENGESLNNYIYEVVGISMSPEYISPQREASTINNEEIDTYVIIPEENFTSEVYSRALISLDNVKNSNIFSNEYKDIVDEFISNNKKNFDKFEKHESDKIINDLEIEYSDALKKYESMEAIYGAENLVNEYKELETFKEKISKIPDGQWAVLDNHMNYGVLQYDGMIDQMNAIALVFPIFFILVGVLICQTTMSRMVDEERMQIGILRALGYTSSQCKIKFIIYSLIASIFGGMIGSIVGVHYFSSLIYNIWAKSYMMPEMIVNIPWQLIISGNILFLFVMFITTNNVASKLIKEKPSQILRPKSPVLGKDILLEKIKFLWNKLSFTVKITIRNLVRYKKRLFMTVISISGCTALLVAGFGIMNSVSSIMDIQYEQIYKYNTLVYFEEKNSNKQEIKLDLKLNKNINNVQLVESLNEYVSNNDEEYLSNIIILENDDQMDKLYSVTNIDGKNIKLEDDGVIISQKLSELLKLNKGDNIKIKIDDKDYEFKIDEIATWYVDHKIIISKNYYENNTGKEYDENVFFIKANKDIKNYLLENENVSSVETFQQTIDFVQKSIDGINSILVLIIISSGLLAIVVLGSLGNINICEREKEIATLKVLGFSKEETYNYIFYENFILTILGAFLGLVFGALLHTYIIRLVELDSLIFIRFVDFKSLIYAFIITFIFSSIINQILKKQINSIKMVESLKSVE